MPLQHHAALDVCAVLQRFLSQSSCPLCGCTESSQLVARGGRLPIRLLGLGGCALSINFDFLIDLLSPLEAGGSSCSGFPVFPASALLPRPPFYVDPGKGFALAHPGAFYKVPRRRLLQPQVADSCRS